MNFIPNKLFASLVIPCFFAIATNIGTAYAVPREPESPKKILETEFGPRLPKAPLYSPKQVFQAGKEVPFQLVIDDPNWIRQVFVPYWHSSQFGGRWSYVPDRIYHAMHRVFAIYPTASVYYDFVHELGIADLNVPPYAYSHPLNRILIAVFQTDVQRIYAKGNQIVIFGTPRRLGLQILTIDNKYIHPEVPQEPTLIQLVTPQLDEIDRTTTTTVHAHR